MKKILCFLILVIVLLSSQVLAYNIVRIQRNFIDKDQCEPWIEVEVENDELIEDFTIAVSLTRDPSYPLDFDIKDILIVPGSRAENALLWNFEVRNTSSTDTAIIVGHASSPEMPGIAPGSSAFMFLIRLNVLQSGQDLIQGRIYVDSCTNISPYGTWSWGDIQPYFIDAHTIDVGKLPCGEVHFDVYPENDQLIGDHCDGASFQFHAFNYAPGTEIRGYHICNDDTIPQISDSGFFSYPPGDPGTYPITIEAWDNCPVFAQYDFEVVLTNSPMSFTNCPEDTVYCSWGWSVQRDLGLTGLDCDSVTTNIEFLMQPGIEMTFPTCINGIFEWHPTSWDLGISELEITASDPFGAEAVCTLLVEVRDLPGLFCGDANRDQEVNVSDAVYIINYIFVGGPPPDPFDNANVNCDFAVNVSDAVWLINFVFVGGPPPCNCN